jgi:hypothetical protein
MRAEPVYYTPYDEQMQTYSADKTMKNRKKEVQRENNFSLDKYLTGLYHVDTNQRWRRVASEGTAKGAAESGTAVRAADVNGLRRALRKRKPVGSDGQPLPLSRRRISSVCG